MGFKKGDKVVIGIGYDEFRELAIENSSTKSYIERLYMGEYATVVDVTGINSKSVSLKMKGMTTSNWFKARWLKLYNDELEGAEKF